MEIEDGLTIQQTAELLGINRNTVYEALYKGRLPYSVIYGHKVIKRADAEAYQQRTRVSGEKPKGRPKGSKNVKKEAGGEVEAGE